MAPAAILLDLVLADEAWDFLIRLKRNQRTRHVPVLVASVVDAGDKALALGADAFLVKPIQRAMLIETLNGLHARMHPPIRVLVVDDEESARYLVRRCLPAPGFEVIEVADANDAVRRASTDAPDVILLDLVMPACRATSCWRSCGGSAHHCDIPVVIATGATPDRDGPAGAPAATRICRAAEDRAVAPHPPGHCADGARPRDKFRPRGRRRGLSGQPYGKGAAHTYGLRRVPTR